MLPLKLVASVCCRQRYEGENILLEPPLTRTLIQPYNPNPTLP